MANKTIPLEGKELGEGVEFHLSLNSPEYAKEKSGNLEIDYKKIRAIHAAHAAKASKPKQLPKAIGDFPDEPTKP